MLGARRLPHNPYILYYYILYVTKIDQYYQTLEKGPQTILPQFALNPPWPHGTLWPLGAALFFGVPGNRCATGDSIFD